VEHGESVEQIPVDPKKPSFPKRKRYTSYLERICKEADYIKTG
jgi:hypothetical protein